MRKESFIRTAVLVLMLIMAAAPVAAGGQKEQETVKEGPVELSMWTLFGGGEGQYMSDMISGYNNSQNIYIIKEQVIEWSEYYNKLLTALLANDAPDIGIMHLAVLPDYASRNVLTALDSYIPESVQNEILPNILEKANYDGALYAMPMDTHPEVFYYNKTLLKSMDVKIDDIRTWDDLINAGQKFKTETGNVPFTMETVRGNTLGERFWIAMYSQMGGKLGNNQGKLTIDAATALKTYEYINKLKNEGTIEMMDYNSAEALFMNNKSPFHMNGVWAMGAYPDVEGLDFGVRSLPALTKESQASTWGDSHSLILPKNKNNHTAGAAEFLEYFSKNSFDWARAGHLPVNKSVLESSQFNELIYRPEYSNAAAKAVLAPSVKGWAQIRTAMFEICELLIIDQYSPEQATDALMEKISELNK